MEKRANGDRKHGRARWIYKSQMKDDIYHPKRTLFEGVNMFTLVIMEKVDQYVLGTGTQKTSGSFFLIIFVIFFEPILGAHNGEIPIINIFNIQS